MKVLSISGDKEFGPGHSRFELQKSAVDEFVAVYWGKGSLWPKIPKGKFDVVTVQDPFWRGFFAWWVARKIGARFNVQVHVDLQGASGSRKKSVGLGLSLWSADFVGYRERIARFVLHHADSIRTVSEKIKEQVQTLGAQVPISVLPVYIDTSIYGSVVRSSHIGKVILWIGRFEEEKDPLTAIDVINDVVKDIPEARLTMLGKGSLGSALRTQAARRRLAGRVEFPGWQDPAPYLARAAVVLSTSQFEGYGAGIVEALAAGVPVVAPDVGIAREAGAIVVPREELAGAVMKVLEHGMKGELRIKPPDKEEWTRRWKETL